MKPDFSLTKKIAVVTGGTGVLGAAICKALAAAGATVIIMGRKKSSAEKILQEIKVEGGDAIFIQADVLNEADLNKANDQILEQYKTIDILINGAGGNIPGAVVKPEDRFFEMEIKDFNDAVMLNLQGTVLPCKIFAESMAKNKKGVIINISSMTALRPLTRVVAYSAAKAAVANFTQWLSVEMANKYGEGIRVNAIAPGFFLTEQNKRLLTEEDGSLTQRGEQIIAHTPFKRFGNPEDLSGTVVWLCSDASSFVSGITVPVDGGFNAYAGV